MGVRQPMNTPSGVRAAFERSPRIVVDAWGPEAEALALLYLREHRTFTVVVGPPLDAEQPPEGGRSSPRSEIAGRPAQAPST